MNNPNCPCLPLWNSGVTPYTGGVGWFFDDNVTATKFRNAANNGAGYWNNIKNMHNGKTWFVSGPTWKVVMGTTSKPSAAAEVNRMTRPWRIIISSDAKWNYLTEAQWSFLLAHEFGHVLNWGHADCSESVTVMKETLSTVPALGSARSGDRCAYQSAYHQF